ncbi:MAG: 6-carboxytetrahydropterin synthase QueD [Endomicrobium sp.]|jgi:6-pyruvoyltetrahydropterin/6-carboxytetrahydropterin synthase|nr:6-carboxytetrahydropterin synthase QueD [Endomicrobium sp.]
MNYKLSVVGYFSAAHCLKNYKGKCESLHGHNWKVKLSFLGTKLDNVGMLIDFSDAKKHMYKIITCFDHKFLNETKPFDKINPTVENIASFIFEQLKKNITLEHIKIYKVEVWENKYSSVSVYI